MGEDGNVAVEDEAAVSVDIEGGFSLDGLDGLDLFLAGDVVVLLLDEEIDFAVVDDDEFAFAVLVLGEDAVLFFVDGTDELEGYLVLEVDGEVGEEEDALLNDADVGFVDEVLLYI